MLRMATAALVYSGITVKMLVPGVEKDQLQITIDEDVLTVRGEVRKEHEEKKKNFFRQEIRYGAFERIQAGNLLRAESEYIETALTANVSANTIGVLRGRNGATAAAHVQGTALYVWRVPEPVKQAAVIQATRELQRGLQGFGDARANPELGELIFFKSIDPEAAAKLAPYRRLEIP